MASSPLLESHANSTPLSDRGFHPGLSGPDLATGTAITSVQAQCFGLQVSQKHLEARLQQMSESQTQMMTQMSDMMSHILVLSQPQQPQRRQGRPHPGKSMRAKKRKQAQALLEQANSSSSEGASDVDGPAAASGPAAAVAMPPMTAGSTSPSGTAGGTGSRPQGSTDEVAVAVASKEATAATAVPRDGAGAASLAAPAAQSHQTDEGWFDVAAQVESSAIPAQIGTPRPEPLGVASSLALEAQKDLVKAVAEEVCGKLLEAVKMEFSAASQVAMESHAAMIAQAERMQRDVADEAIEALKEEQSEKQATDSRTALTDNFATLQSQLQSDFACLRREFQEAFQKNEELYAESGTRIRSIGEDVAAMKLEIADLKARTLQFPAVTEQNTCSKQAAPAEDRDLPPPPGLSAAAPAAGQAATAGQTEALNASVAPAPRTPQGCRVVACYWYKGMYQDCWNLRKQMELAEPFLVTAATLRDVKVEAAKALWPTLSWDKLHSPGFWQQLKNFDGSRSFAPSQAAEERKSLQALGCGEASFVKVHFRKEWLGSDCWQCWWSYEVIA